MITKLKTKHILQLRKLAHHLKVVVIIGQHGLRDAVLSEIDLALNQHELIKVRINAGDREQRRHIVHTIADKTQSHIVQQIGHLGVFYRCGDKPKIMLSP